MDTLTYQDTIAAAQAYERRALFAATAAGRHDTSTRWHAIMLEYAESNAKHMEYLYFVAECIAKGETWYTFEVQS